MRILTIVCWLASALAIHDLRACTDDLAVQLRFPKHVNAGEPIKFAVEVRNCSSRAIAVVPQLIVGEGNLELFATSAGGRRIRVTNYIVDPCTNVGAPLVLGPGEFFGRSMIASARPEDIHIMFNGEGTYTIRARLHLPSCGFDSERGVMKSGIFDSTIATTRVAKPLADTVQRMRHRLSSSDQLALDEALTYFAMVRDSKADAILRRLIGPPSGWEQRNALHARAITLALIRQGSAEDKQYLRAVVGAIPRNMIDIQSDIRDAIADHH